MGQKGFWDEQERVSKLKNKKPVLTCLSESIPWEAFRPLLEKGYSQERKSNAGRKRIDPLILFKMLVLQQLFNLSDEEVEFQVNDRRSFEEFVGLGVMNDIPDATTVAFFRERLRKANVIDELFEMFESYLRDQGLEARGGQIIDATLLPVLKQHNSGKIIKRSRQIACQMDRMKAQRDCSKGNWMRVGSKRTISITIVIKTAFALMLSTV